MQFVEKIFRKENVKVEVKNEKGESLYFWNDNKLGKFLLALGLSMKIPRITGGMYPYISTHNMIVATGLAGFASRIYDDSIVKKFTLMALGSNGTPTVIEDVALTSEIVTNGGGRGIATINRITVDELNDTTIYQKTWNITGSLLINEAGIFNADNQMLARVIVGPINVADLYVFTLNWSIKNN